MGAPRGSRRRDVTGFSWDPKSQTARCNVYIKGGGGKTRKRVTIHAASKDEAQEKWIAYRKRWRANAETTGEIPTLAAFIEEHFDDICAGLKPSTIAGYRSMLDARILPEFGHVRMNELTSGRLNLWVTRLQETPNQNKKGKKLSCATVNATVNVLKIVISRAVKWDVLAESPLRKPIERLKPNLPAQELNDAERKAFLAAFDDVAGFHAWIEKTMPRGTVREIASKNDRFGRRRRHGASYRAGSEAAQHYFERYRHLKPFFVALLELGLRRGDALQLRWSEVDFTAGLVRLTTRKRDVDVVLPISRACREALLERRRAPVVSEFVFTTEEGKLLPEVRVRRAFKIAKELSGIRLPFRLHDCRHTFASALVSRGASLATVAALLAHADTRTTTRYARMNQMAAAEAARTILDAMGQE